MSQRDRPAVGSQSAITAQATIISSESRFSRASEDRVPNYEASRDARCVKVAFLGVPRHSVAIDSLDVTLTLALGPRAPTL